MCQLQAEEARELSGCDDEWLFCGYSNELGSGRNWMEKKARNQLVSSNVTLVFL
jgi:hypothetical protein